MKNFLHFVRHGLIVTIFPSLSNADTVRYQTISALKVKKKRTIERVQSFIDNQSSEYGMTSFRVSIPYCVEGSYYSAMSIKDQQTVFDECIYPYFAEKRGFKVELKKSTYHPNDFDVYISWANEENSDSSVPVDLTGPE